jgi:hypothetical protein|tara:strand:+ start:327 stop:590 length:264 start_codon:yes stop_codon:yes gene_type:complete
MSEYVGIEMPLFIEVHYDLEDEDAVLDPYRIVPVILTEARLRGKDLLPIMHIGHIIHLQKAVFAAISDEEKGAWLGYEPKKKHAGDD